MSQPEILGFTKPETDDAKLINQFKQIEEALARVVDEARGTDLDQRLVSIAATHFMEGFMSLNRAVCKPGRVQGTIFLDETVGYAEEMLKARKTLVAGASIDSNTIIAPATISGGNMADLAVAHLKVKQ